MKKISFLLMCLLFTFGLKAQITRQQADALVTNQIFTSSLGNVDIYAFPEMVTSSERIDLADGTSIAVPYHSCYAYFIDLMPFANWSHPCKYCFVNANGSHSMVDAEMAPEEEHLSAISLMQRPVSTPNYTIPENAHGNSFELGDMSHKWAVLICGNHHGNGEHGRFWFDLSSVYTVLANVYHYQEPAPDELFDYTNRRIFVTAPESISKMFCIESEYYSSQLNTTSTPFSESTYPGDFINRRGHDEDLLNHSKGNIENLFQCFVDEDLCAEYNEFGYGFRPLTEDDELFIYITGHGGKDGGGCYFTVKNTTNGTTYEKIYDYELVEWLRGIECSQITLVMQNCNSGGFIDEFLGDINNENCRCKNRIGLSAASADGVSRAESYGITNYSREMDGPGFVNEFTYHWTAAALGYYPIYKLNDDGNLVDIGPWTPSGRNIGDGTMNWSDYFEHEASNPHTPYDVDPDTDNDRVLSLKELFSFSDNLNVWTEMGYFNPNYGFTPYLAPVPDEPQSAYESTFTAEAATLVGYEGQVDGDVTSGTARQPYRLCGDLWTGPHTRVDMTDDIYVPEGNKIYIQPSSHIQLRNCTVDKLPESNGMWEGIQVWGQNDQPQDLQHQGGLYMDNASIKNAIVAVDLWNPWVYETTGGIFRAYNSTFINNAKGLRIEEYQYRDADNNIIDYNADLKNCTFLVNDNFIGTENFCEHVKLVHVKGIRFDGCKFKLELERPNSHVASWAKGILAFDAGFRLDSYDWQGHPMNQAEVKGLFMGVHAVHDLDEMTMPFNIFNTNFIDNDCGVFASQVGLPTIVNSNFLIGRQGTDCAMGIYVEGINRFTIEQNNFRKAEHAPQNNYGIVIKESHSEGTQIYNNNFSNLYCGNLAIGLNRSENGEGLEYRCNDNSSNDIDFYVWNENNNNSAGVKSFQGLSTLAADNKFSHDAYHFFNGGTNKVIYYYQRNAADEQPIRYNTAVTVYDTETSDGCPLRYDTHVSSGKLPLLSASKRLEREMDYYNALNTYNSVKTLYNRLTDGGNTNGTISSIKTANPWQMWDLRAQLLGASPYLSEEVLKEVADRNDVFTESVLFEILASNPDELKKGDIIDYVKNKTNPLPEYMTDILEQVAAGNTYKTVLLNQMSSYSRDYHNAATDIIRSILADSIVNTTELRGWLGNLNDLGADREIIASYMAEGDFDNAFALANMLPTLYEFASEEMDEHADYMRMLNLYRSLRQAGRNTRQLTQQEIEDIEDIAENSTGTPQRMAQNILEANSLRHFADCPNAPYPGGQRGSSDGQIDPELFGKAMGLSVEAKPNPATTWVAIDYTLPGDAEKAILTLTNALGVKVASYNLSGHQGQKVLDLREFASGVYTCTIACGEYFQTQKIVIAQ